MRARKQQFESWDNEDANYNDNNVYGAYDAYDDAQGAYANQYSYDDDGQYANEQYAGAGVDLGYDANVWGGDAEQGLALQPENSLVGVSNTVTHHGAPLLSYTRTMNRFYTSRKQRLSLGRYKCEVCHERIRFWAWETTNGTHTHDGCYERLAWTWTSLYAQQQALASMGKFE